jgi:hypothetical protein
MIEGGKAVSCQRKGLPDLSALKIQKNTSVRTT